jgi:hypothetical protein
MARSGGSKRSSFGFPDELSHGQAGGYCQRTAIFDFFSRFVA